MGTKVEAGAGVMERPRGHDLCLFERAGTIIPQALDFLNVDSLTEFDHEISRRLGHQFDILAFDLLEAGYEVSRRLAYAAAFVLNSLAEGRLPLRPDIAEETRHTLITLQLQLDESQIENDCISDSTIDPTELNQRPNPLIDRESASASVSGDTIEIRFELLTSLDQDGINLADASESLLNRIQKDATSPYSAPASRVHHLAVSLSKRISELTKSPEELAIPISEISAEEISVAQASPSETPSLEFHDDEFHEVEFHENAFADPHSHDSEYLDAELLELDLESKGESTEEFSIDHLDISDFSTDHMISDSAPFEIEARRIL
ncbi:MAG: hypothetical protein FJ267_08125, partial [Planctomycetes bacterium]|nr:hypothetical protein [Planctomycetota bacterium]